MDEITEDAILRQGNAAGEAAWLDVIRKMDETYAELVGHQVELEQKNTALEEAHSFIGDIMAAMTDVLVVTGTDKLIRQVNRSLERASGQDGPALVGKPLAAVFEAASANALDRFIERLTVRTRVEDAAMALKGPDGGFPLSVNLSPITDHRGRVAGAVLVGRPVGELKKAYADLASAHDELRGAQDRLVRSEKMAALGRLVAGVAHEINNPMSFVYGNSHALKRYCDRLIPYVEALHRGDRKGAEALRDKGRIDAILADLPQLLGGILEGSERTRDIVESLRRYSSDQGGSREVVDLVQLVHTAVRWVAKGQRPDLIVSHDLPDVLEIEAHSGNIQQVVMNIVQNAVDAMAERPEARLDIACRRQGRMVELAFRDHGPGIAAEHMVKLFDPFFTTKPVGRGTGLGLSISYEIVQNHGGVLEAANDPQGGAVFTLRLPVEAKR